MAYASIRRTTALALAAGTGLCIPSLSQASIINWINAAGGSAGTASNWNPAQVPTSADDLFFSIAGTYAVNFPNNVNATRTQTYTRGTVTSTFSGHQLSSTLLVAPSNPNVATLNLVGALYVNNSAVIGRDAGSNGTMSIAAGVNFITILGPGNVLIVGNSGTGVLNINGGSLARIDTDGDDIRIGNFASGIGTVNLSSSNGLAATMRINNPVPGADLIVGSQGIGTLNIGTRGLVLAGADAHVAISSGAQGDVNFTDATGSAPGTMTVPRDLHLAHNTSAAAAGSAHVTVDGNGLLQIGTSPSSIGTLFLGDADGGSGILTIIRGEVQTQNIVIDPPHGGITQLGGTLRIMSGGSFSPPSTLNVSGTLAGNEPVVRYEASTGTLNGGFRIGDTGNGKLEAVQGAVIQAVPSISGGLPVGSMIIGSLGGSRGTLNVSGIGSRVETADIPGSLAIGGNGSATVTISDHGVLDTHASVVISSGTATSSTVDLSGASTFNTALRFFIGGIGTPQGVGQVSLQGSSNLNCAQLTVQQGSSLSIDDSTVSVGGGATIRGTATIGAAGELAANSISIVGSLTGNGTVYGNVSIASGATVHAAGGNLFLGSPANAPASFSSQGTLQIDGQEVHILSSTPAAAGTIVLNGGSLHGTGGLVFGPTGSLTGGGSIFTPMQFDSQTFVQSTISPGFTFNAPVTGHLNAAFGSTFTFAAGGDFTGQGDIQTFIRIEEEASVAATGDLGLGLNNVSNCVQFTGQLHVGSHLVEVRSDSPANLGVLTTINGGTLKGPASNPRTVVIGGIPFTFTDAVPFILSGGFMLRGSGQVMTKIQAFPTSIVQLTGDMSFAGSGDTTILSGLGQQYVSWDATLDVGSHSASFSGIHQMGGVVTFDGGTIEAGILRIFGSLSGSGVLRSGTGVQNRGLISPGGDAIGEIVVQSTFSTTSAALDPGVLEMDVDGDQGHLHDTLRVEGGDVTLGGHIRVRVLSLPPDPAIEYPLIVTDTGIITGAFDTADLPAGMTLVYRNQEVVLTGFCPADFNQDGGVDGNDVDAFFASWEAGDASADVNRDGGVDGSDVDGFFSLWEAGGC